jgi:hypothetical protein
MLDYIRLKRFKASDPQHKELAALSRKAHGAAARGDDALDFQSAIDDLAASLWGLSKSDAKALATASG